MADSDKLVHDVYFDCEEDSMHSESVPDEYEHSELDWSSDTVATSNTSNMNNSPESHDNNFRPTNTFRPFSWRDGNPIYF